MTTKQLWQVVCFITNDDSAKRIVNSPAVLHCKGNDISIHTTLPLRLSTLVCPIIANAMLSKAMVDLRCTAQDVSVVSCRGACPFDAIFMMSRIAAAKDNYQRSEPVPFALCSNHRDDLHYSKTSESMKTC